MNILLTGASGFVGQGLLKTLESDPAVKLHVASRRKIINIDQNTRLFNVGDLHGNVDWRDALLGMDVVIHTAGRAHITSESSSDPLEAFRKVNVRATLALAQQSAQASVRRFIFISSISVHGLVSGSGRFTEDSSPAPYSPYGISKYEAELGLREIERNTGMEVVIIRPPLVYGNNPPGNLAILLKAIFHGWPFPIALIKNKRTLVALENLVDLVITCTHHRKAGGETFLAGDAQDVSTPEIIGFLAEGMSKQVVQLSVPAGILKIGATILRREPLYQQLCGSLQIDTAKARTLLDWAPSVSVTEGLVEVGRYYASMHD